MQKQNEYIIKIHSRRRFFITVVILMGSGLIFNNNYFPKVENEFLLILILIFQLGVALYLSGLAASARIKVILTEEGIHHIWERRFILSSEKDIKIPWSMVDNYDFKSFRAWESLIVNLTTKMKYQINRFAILPKDDDFWRLGKEFHRLSYNSLKEKQFHNN